MVALARCRCRLHLPQQVIHLIHIQPPSGPDRAMTGHGAANVFESFFEDETVAEFRQLVGEISQLDGPLGGIDASNSTAGPFGPFARDVNLVHPVDVTTPVKSQMGLGILELSFQKGYPNS